MKWAWFIWGCTAGGAGRVVLAVVLWSWRGDSVVLAGGPDPAGAWWRAACSPSSPTRSAAIATSACATADRGVGKTLSARRYACWHELEPLLRAPGCHFTEGRGRADWNTLLYTPTVSATPRMIDKELTQLASAFAIIRTPDPFDRRTHASTHALPPFVELLIIDEADRLKTTALEQFRDHYDRSRSA
jgi:hypothetical protein